MKKGTNDITLKIGNADVEKAYLGVTEVYSSSLLPTGYTQLQYVASAENGGWVDIDILPENTLGYELEFMTKTVSPRDSAFFGARESSANTRYTFGVYNGTLFVGWNTSLPSSGAPSIAADTWYKLSVNKNNERKARFKTSVITLGTSIGTFTRPIQVFGYNNYNGHGAAREMSVKYIELTRGADIISHLVPCIDPNNEVGFYDIVRERFFGSGNGIALIAGPAA